MKVIDIRNLNLEVDPSSEWVLQRCGPKPASRTIRLLKHQMDGATRQVSEALLRAFDQAVEPQSISVEPKRSVQVSDIEFWYNGWSSVRHAEV